MNSEKYIGLGVHQATIVVAVMDATGKLVMESILEIGRQHRFCRSPLSRTETRKPATACSRMKSRSVEGLFQHPLPITLFDPRTGSAQFSKRVMASREKSRNSLQTRGWREASFHASS